jgi:hypothetical protein
MLRLPAVNHPPPSKVKWSAPNLQPRTQDLSWINLMLQIISDNLFFSSLLLYMSQKSTYSTQTIIQQSFILTYVGK